MRAHLLLLAVAAGLVAIAAGPGLWGSADPAAWVASWQKALYASVCHQDANRSIWLNGAPMAVCDRCFGIYAGTALGLVLAFAIRPRIRALKVTAVWAVIAILIDVAATLSGIWPPLRPVRVATGLVLGCAAGLLLVSWRNPPSTPR
jgi:uncharacterized membrane protein